VSVPEKKAKVNARALVEKLNKQSAALREHEILAPVLPGGRIRTRLDGLVYEFKPKGRWVGWGRFQPLNEFEAVPLGEAMPWQRSDYLHLFPTLRVILLWPVERMKDEGGRLNRRTGRPTGQAASESHPSSFAEGTQVRILHPSQAWWALPYNESDARQRFGLAGGEMIPVYFCDPLGGADRFERVVARVDGRALWFDGPDALADPMHAEWLREAASRPELPEKYRPGLAASERLALLFGHIRQLELDGQLRPPAGGHRNQREQQEWLRQQAGRSRLEQRLRYALAKADATLHSFAETANPDGSPGPLVVEWSEQGQNYRYRSTIDPNLTVVSSGICLSGHDNDFDLTSLVSVMEAGS
jgi:hypothetical protein